MIKTLAREIKQYKKASILTPIFVTIEVILEIIIPFLMAKIIDLGVEKGDMSMVLLYGGLMLAASFISLYAGFKSGKYSAYASSGFAANLRLAMFKNIQTYAFENIDKYSTAGLVTRMTTDVTNVQNAYQMIIRICFRAPIMLVSAMIMAFTINGELSMVFLFAVIFLGIILFSVVKITFKIFDAAFKKYDNLNASVQENVTGIRTVKAYVREDYETSRFKKASKDIYDIFMKAEKRLLINSPAMQFTMYSCIILLSYIGAQMIVVDNLTTGELMSLFTYTSNILMSLMMISMVFVMITMSIASMRRIAEVLEEKPTIVSPQNAIKSVDDGSVVFEHVSFITE